MYVGRIVVVGAAHQPFVAYRVSARSFPNRVACITELGVAIQPLDPADLARNPYIAYNAIRISSNGAVVSNGSHTDAIFAALESGASPETALRNVLTEMGYEKDEYNTPRIAGIATADRGFLGIVRADGLEVAGFELAKDSCQFVCTNQLDRLTGAAHPFLACNPRDAAHYMVNGGLFGQFEHPVCSAAWMDGFAVHNLHVGSN